MTNISSTTLFGGTGFIGRYIVQRLAQAGSLVRLPTRDIDKALPLKVTGEVGQITPILCSTRDDAAIAEAMRGADTLINLLGILFEKGSNSFQCIHVETAARLARIAREQGVKNFVHFSALGADSQSKSSYARSKAAGEAAVRTFFPEAIILRPSIVFGPEDGFFNLFASLARFAPALPLIGGGHSKFQPIYVGDVADAVMSALRNPTSAGKTYQLGGGTIYSFRALMELMLSETARKNTLVNLPWGIASLMASAMELLPTPLLTRDQVELLKTDNVIHDPSALNLGDLGITPTALEIILPSYLDSYRLGGKFSAAA